MSMRASVCVCVLKEKNEERKILVLHWTRVRRAYTCVIIDQVPFL